jgi:hypothetical protein
MAGAVQRASRYSWTHDAERGIVGPLAGFGGMGEWISNRMASTQRCCPLKIYLRCAHVAPEPTGDAVGLSDPVERFLASTGMSNGGWDGRKLQVTQDACAHRFLGDGSNDPE